MALVLFLSLLVVLSLGYVFLAGANVGIAGGLIYVLLIPGMAVEMTVSRYVNPTGEAWWRPMLGIVCASLFWTVCGLALLLILRALSRLVGFRSPWT